ncbi:hypothetical protein ABT072_47740, partial [Streptomyces sp. NPDC002589]|uniref:hypothetical protein n=1 Tax=Streptomyces sp. NPDC002589 TaxID=3154420 RepID=UPI00331BEE05
MGEEFLDALGDHHQVDPRFHAADGEGQPPQMPHLGEPPIRLGLRVDSPEKALEMGGEPDEEPVDVGLQSRER